MKMNGIEFGNAYQASGATNFFGEGFWFHKPLRLLGLTWKGTVFVSKTATLNSRAGNMPTRKDGCTPQKWFPDCVYVDLKKEVVLNAVGLTNLGLGALLEKKIWQQRCAPFGISVTSTGKSLKEQTDDYSGIARLLKMYKPQMPGPFFIQENLSCPNVPEVKHDNTVAEAASSLPILAEVGVPVEVKVSATLAPEAAG